MKRLVRIIPAWKNLCVYSRFRPEHKDWPYVIGDIVAVLLIVGACLLLGSCADMNHGLQKVMLGVDCRPEKLLPNGHCAPVR